jgi:hypothetical protein
MSLAQIEGPASAHAGLCLSCNYRLLNLPPTTTRCPECGHPFDPTNPATMNMGRPLPAWVVWALGPIRWPIRLLTAGAAAMALWSARLPGADFSLGRRRTLVLLAAVAAVWLAWPLLRLLVARRFRWRTRQITGRDHTGFTATRLLAPLLLVLAVAAVAARYPLRLSFRFSRAAMAKLVEEAETSRTQLKPRRVGLYRAAHVQTVPGGVKFTVEDSDASYRAGFAYLPSVNPATATWHTYHYLGDGWWSWREEG